MPKPVALPRAEVEELDRVYREGSLLAMASPLIHYDEALCPHPDCGHRMEWIDFKLELHGDPERAYRPLVRSWWEGTDFVGRRPVCQGWFRFTTLAMIPCHDAEAGRPPRLPENWASVAQIA